MKRKLFSAILFGACLVASTSGLTSCKDYDDDISNLQSQIDKLATKEELATKASELSSSISAAQSAADAAKKTAEDAAAAAKTATTGAEAAQKAADAAQAAADKAQKAADAAQAAADKNAEDLKKAAEGATKAVEEIQNAMKGLATTEAVNAAVKEVADKYDAQAKDLKALSDRLDKVEAKLGLGEGGEDIDLTEIQAELEDIEDAFEALVGVVSDMVTSVELVYNSAFNGYANQNDLTFTIVTEQDNVFGKDVADKTIETKKGHTLFEGDEVYVRVNPVDADLTASDFTLINSKGEELTGLVEATKVERYSDKNYMTRAAGANTGLWKVTFAPVDGKKADDLKKKFVVDQSTGYVAANYIVYAVGVKSAISDSIASDRRVVSAYDITMKTAEANAYAAYIDDYKSGSTYAGNLVDIVVNKKSIKDLKNRTGLGDNPKEKVWKNTTSTSPYVITTHTTLKDQNNIDLYVEGTDKDDRTTGNYLVAGLGEDINIVFKDYNNPAADKKIKAFYVTLDEKFAYESSPSEINAWKSYTYENLGHMFNGNEGTIKVSALSGTAINDIIGFRIYALNLDGTLVDPDGIAFYVSVGNKGGENTLTAQTINVTEGAATDAAITAAYNGKNVTGDIDVTDLFKDAKNTGTGSTGAVTWTCSKGADNVTPKIDGTTYRYESAYTIWYHNVAGNGGTPAAGWNQIFDPTRTYDKIRVQILKPQAFVDDATYTLTATVNGKSNSTDYTLRTIKVDVTKAMPTEVPPFRFKPGQTEQQLVVDNSPTYPYAVTNGKKDATIDLKNIFVRTDGTLLNADPNFSVKLAESKWNTTDSKYEDLTGTSYVYTLAPKTSSSTTNELVDGGAKSHAVVGSYTWGNISRRVKDGTYQSLKYTLPIVNNYNLKYYSWSETEQPGYQSYSWKPIYGSGDEANVIKGYEDKVTIAATTTLKLTNIVAATGDKSASYFEKANLDAYYAAGTEWLKIDKVTLTTDGLENVYFRGAADACTTANGNTITFKAVQNIDNIPAHTAAMVIQMHDCFGYKSYVKLDVKFVK